LGPNCWLKICDSSFLFSFSSLWQIFNVHCILLLFVCLFGCIL
jgi:hypothetical protein